MSKIPFKDFEFRSNNKINKEDCFKSKIEAIETKCLDYFKSRPTPSHFKHADYDQVQFHYTYISNDKTGSIHWRKNSDLREDIKNLVEQALTDCNEL